MLFRGLVLLGGQLISMQSRPVIHLQPHKNTIEAGFGGGLVELINAPAVIYLPQSPPKVDEQGEPWSVEVKNLGPASVMVTGTQVHFQAAVSTGQTVHIDSNGTTYLLKR
jgi:hypothetical protein